MSLSKDEIATALIARLQKGDSLETLRARLYGCNIYREDGSEWTIENIKSLIDPFGFLTPEVAMQIVKDVTIAIRSIKADLGSSPKEIWLHCHTQEIEDIFWTSSVYVNTLAKVNILGCSYKYHNDTCTNIFPTKDITIELTLTPEQQTIYTKTLANKLSKLKANIIVCEKILTPEFKLKAPKEVVTNKLTQLEDYKKQLNILQEAR